MTRFAKAGRRMLRAIAGRLALLSRPRCKGIAMTVETTPESLLRDIGLIDGRWRPDRRDR